MSPEEFENEPTRVKTREYPNGVPPVNMDIDDTCIVDDPDVLNVPFPELTPRERQVALLLVLGQKNSEIAVELQLSVKTVDTHRAAILRKLQKRNNVELTLLACREKWIVP